MTRKEKIFLFISSFYIIILTNSIFLAYVPLQNSVYSFGVFIICFLLYPKAFFNKSLICFCLYALILFTYSVSGKNVSFYGTTSPLLSTMIEMGFILPSLSIISITIYTRNFELLKLLAIISLITINITFFQMIINNTLNTELLREAALDLNSKGDNALIYAKKGLPSYSFLHVIPLLLPFCLGLIKEKKGNEKLFFFIFSLLLIFIIFKSAITTTILYSFFVLLCILLYRENKKLQNIFMLLIITIIFLLVYNTNIISLFLDFLINIFSGTPAEDKMIDFKRLYLVGEMGGTISGRQSLHQISWESFVSNPIFGGEIKGGHSSLLDRLGVLGLFGFIPFALILFYQYKQWKNILSPTSLFYFRLSWLGALILLIMKGLFGSIGWLFLYVILPGIALLFENNKKINKNVTFQK